MKFNTIVKAGTLAFDILNHQSTQALSGLVRNGVKRRVAGKSIPFAKSGKSAKAQKEPSLFEHFLGIDRPPYPMHPMHSHPGLPHNPHPYHASRMVPPRSVYQVPQQPLPTEHIKKALKYVTPENMQKAMQWRDIVKSLISKE
ncbi:hypothetical protein [Sulfoacidibacillus thermotolerans]|uniref:Uncharacterized protein n=1 Tax=Sulfoacidibacillus thermotolerans TaxID=1765684 RepID=A0A2U3D7A6_SULT2|nr:hypothetical protein [Sulfoacidibacillus thermotolerans]PWI57158.1 hypothetical protein BM613_09810 [Sulfoacidibacillus thermotolerans]